MLLWTNGNSIVSTNHDVRVSLSRFHRKKKRTSNNTDLDWDCIWWHRVDIFSSHTKRHSKFSMMQRFRGKMNYAIEYFCANFHILNDKMPVAAIHRDKKKKANRTKEMLINITLISIRRSSKWAEEWSYNGFRKEKISLDILTSRCMQLMTTKEQLVWVVYLWIFRWQTANLVQAHTFPCELMQNSSDWLAFVQRHFHVIFIFVVVRLVDAVFFAILVDTLL